VERPSRAGAPSLPDSDFALARALLAGTAPVLVLTGAGISAESGVPIFRGAGGLWRQHRPEDLATPEAFAPDPRLVWEWYEGRRAALRGCEPNAGHLALARWMLSRPDVTLVTQNVDRLHERASERVSGDSARTHPVRLHGTIEQNRCTACEYVVEHPDPSDTLSHATLPRCPECGSLLRPDVVWFGEMLPEAAVSCATRAAQRARVCLVVGTAGAVHPAAGFAMTVHENGGALVVVDPGDTAFDPIATVKLRGEAGTILPELLGVGVSSGRL
jgi:NAD-dependent deacetylase